MKALLYHDYGGPEVLKFEDVAIPSPGPGEILVKVAGAGINPVDWKIRAGFTKAWLPAKFPQIIGREFSGTVAELGEGVSTFEIGDEVYGIAPGGTFAEYTVASAKESGLKPPSMDLADAAAVPLAGMTAWQAIFDVGGLDNGQKALIHAAAGGVGTFAVQFAKWKGAYVYGTSSRENFHLLEELGVDCPIDYHADKFEEIARDVDLVLETIGGDQVSRSLAALKKGGILVSVVGGERKDEAEAQGKRAESMRMAPERDLLEEIAGLIQDLQVRPIVSVVPFREAVEAFIEAEKGHTRGKSVIRIS